jgi:hypothetical protein
MMRGELPQLGGGLFLTDGGIETTLPTAARSASSRTSAVSSREPAGPSW